MPDFTIAMQGKPTVELMNPMDVQLKRNAMLAQQMQMEKYRQAQDNQNFMAQAGGALDVNDPTQVQNFMARGGEDAAQFVKNVQGARAGQYNMQQQQQQDSIKLLGRVFHSTISDPSDEAMDSAYQDLLSAGVKPEKAAATVGKLKALPLEQRSKAVQDMVLADPDTREIYKMTLPKPVQANLGNRIVWIDQNPLSITYNKPLHEEEVKGVMKIVEGIDGFSAVDTRTGVATPVTTGGGATPVTTGGGASALATNPGALKDGPFARSQPGYTGASGGFATFETPQAGAAAQQNLLRTRYLDKGVNTVSKIIDRYAPQGPENSPASVANYKAYVAGKLGIGPDQPVPPDKLPVLAQAMREFETGQTSSSAGRQLQGKPKADAAAANSKMRVEEGKASSAIKDIGTAVDDMVSILANDPTSVAKSSKEYAASWLPFVGDEAALWSQSEGRQKFDASLEKVLAAVTTLNTGAGVNETQLKSYRKTYAPTIQDTPGTRKFKLQGMVKFLRNQKERAGGAWTPTLDAKLAQLEQALNNPKLWGEKPKTKAAAPARSSSLPPDIAKQYGL